MFDYQRVKRLRGELGLSENQFAKKIGVSQSTYNRFEKGLTSLPTEAIVEIAKVFSVDTEWLLFGTGGEEPVFKNDKKGFEESSDYVKVPVSEYIDLLRKLNKQQDEEIKDLQQQLERTKNH